MLTRGYVAHPYSPIPVEQVNTPGYVRVARVDGIVQTWAISRPGSAPDPIAAPNWINENASPPNQLIQTGFMPLIPARPKVMMDPSDPSTWQRQYRFTQ